MLVNESWSERVLRYVDALETAASEIDGLLRRCRVDTENVQSPEVHATMQGLTAQLARLEELVADREALLEADDAPNHGTTLTEKLASTSSHFDNQLAKRCHQVSLLVADVNHRAVSLFVCQYHLAEFGSQLIRLVAGEDIKPTYKVDGRPDSTGPGGGLLDEAA